MDPRPSMPRPPAAPARVTSFAHGEEKFPYIPFFAAYAVFAIYFFINAVEPYLAASDLLATRILADTITYETICVTGVYYFDWTTLRDIGPCIALQITNFNSALLSMVNAALVVVSSLWLAKAYDRNWKAVMFLILVNPITFLSIFGANKEVFGLVAFVMLAIFMRNRSLAALAICLVTSLFTRLPVMIIVAAYCLMLVTLLPSRGLLSRAAIRRYLLLIVAMVVMASVIAAVFGQDLQYNLLGDFLRADDINKALEISLSLDNLSYFGLYMINCVVRLFFNLYSGMVGFLSLIDGRPADYYTIGVAGSSAMFVVLTAVVLAGRRADDLRGTALAWNIVTFIALFALILCISPVIQHRYFYPLIVFLILAVTRRLHMLAPVATAAPPDSYTPVMEEACPSAER